jgi:hypothetical protein
MRIETAERKELGYGFHRGYKGLVFSIRVKKNGVNLGVAWRASLEDPASLLQTIAPCPCQAASRVSELAHLSVFIRVHSRLKSSL